MIRGAAGAYGHALRPRSMTTLETSNVHFPEISSASCQLVLATTGPPLPTDGGGAPQETVTGDNGAGNGGKAPAPGFGGDFMLILIGAMVLMIVFSIFGSRKEKKKKEEMLSSIKRHDRVQTIGGVVGSIVEVKSNEVILKVDESSNTRITFARSAVQQVLSSGRDASGRRGDDEDEEESRD